VARVKASLDFLAWEDDLGKLIHGASVDVSVQEKGGCAKKTLQHEGLSFELGQAVFEASDARFVAFRMRENHALGGGEKKPIEAEG